MKDQIEPVVFFLSVRVFGTLTYESITIDELKEIEKRFDRMDAKNKIILTTEKDAMRLMKFKNEISNLPLFVIPVKHRFLFDSGSVFDSIVIRFIENFKSQE